MLASIECDCNQCERLRMNWRSIVQTNQLNPACLPNFMLDIDKCKKSTPYKTIRATLYIATRDDGKRYHQSGLLVQWQTSSSRVVCENKKMILTGFISTVPRLSSKVRTLKWVLRGILDRVKFSPPSVLNSSACDGLLPTMKTSTQMEPRKNKVLDSLDFASCLRSLKDC